MSIRRRSRTGFLQAGVLTASKVEASLFTMRATQADEKRAIAWHVIAQHRKHVHFSWATRVVAIFVDYEELSWITKACVKKCADLKRVLSRGAQWPDQQIAVVICEV
jgi:hypothetical protein